MVSEKLTVLLEDAVANGMVDGLMRRLHPSQYKDGMITVSPATLVEYTKAVIEVTMNNTLDVLPEVIEDTVRRMENASNDVN